MSRHRLAIVGLAMLALCSFIAARAQADDSDSKSEGSAKAARINPGEVQSDLKLLENDVVAKDMELSSDQLASIKKLDDDWETQVADWQKLLPGDAAKLGQRVGETNKEIGGKLNTVLNDEQKARLAQIRLQLRGLAVLHDDDVQDELHFSEDQNDSLKSLNRERDQKIGEARAAAEQMVREKTKEADQATDQKIEALLTPEQRAELDKLTGKKLDLGPDAAKLLDTPAPTTKRRPRRARTKNQNNATS